MSKGETGKINVKNLVEVKRPSQDRRLLSQRVGGKIKIITMADNQLTNLISTISLGCSGAWGHVSELQNK